MEKKNEVIKTNNKSTKVIDIILGAVNVIAFLVLLIIVICFVIDIFYQISIYKPGSGANNVGIALTFLILFSAFYLLALVPILLINIFFYIFISAIKKRGILKISLISNTCLVALYLVLWIFIYVIKYKYC